MINTSKLRQKDLLAMLGIGVALTLIGIVPRRIFAAELAETATYTTEVLGQMMLASVPLLVVGYLFTDILLGDHYLGKKPLATSKLLLVGFCLFYLAELAWLWFFVNPGEELIFDRALVIVLIAALFLDFSASALVGLFAVLVRLYLLLRFDPILEDVVIPGLSDPLGLFAIVIEHRWLLYEPGILGLIVATLLGSTSRFYYQRQGKQAYPIWIGFPSAIVIEAFYLGSVWNWSKRDSLIDLTVNYAIPDILGIGVLPLLLLLLINAAAERARAQKAEILYLQSQINPHFLYNALVTIQNLTLSQPPKACELLAHLGDMYERIAYQRDLLIPLEQELENVQNYWVIVQGLQPGRLHLKQAIGDRVDLQRPVPALILQPLVENAVKHGLTPKGGGTVEIQIEASRTGTVIMVRDDGVGKPQLGKAVPGARREQGVGLPNVISRLQTHYGPAYAPRIDSQMGSGTTITITIPHNHLNQALGATR